MYKDAAKGLQAPTFTNKQIATGRKYQMADNKYYEQIRDRFIYAVNNLVSFGKLNSKRDFTVTHNFDQANFVKQMNQRNRYPSFEMVAVLAKKYHVNLEWLMLVE